MDKHNVFHDRHRCPLCCSTVYGCASGPSHLSSSLDVRRSAHCVRVSRRSTDLSCPSDGGQAPLNRRSPTRKAGDRVGCSRSPHLHRTRGSSFRQCLCPGTFLPIQGECAIPNSSRG